MSRQCRSGRHWSLFRFPQCLSLREESNSRSTFRLNALMTPMCAIMVRPLSSTTRSRVSRPATPRDPARASLRVMSWRPRGRGFGSSKARDQSAMTQPGRANVGAAMIAHGAEHPPLQLSKGHIVGESADVQFGVVITVRIAAIDGHVVTPVGSHVGQRHRLIVKHQVRDRPGHRLSKRERGHRQIIRWDGSRTGQRCC